MAGNYYGGWDNHGYSGGHPGNNPYGHTMGYPANNGYGSNHHGHSGSYPENYASGSNHGSYHAHQLQTSFGGSNATVNYNRGGNDMVYSSAAPSRPELGRRYKHENERLGEGIGGFLVSGSQLFTPMAPIGLYGLYKNGKKVAESLGSRDEIEYMADTVYGDNIHEGPRKRHIVKGIGKAVLRR